MASQRSKDTYQQYIYDFIKDIYVICPSCKGRAIIKSPGFQFKKTQEDEVKMVCAKCGHSKKLAEKPTSVLSASSHKVITGRYYIIGANIDPYFHLPLWLTAPCGDHILWAYNYEHLAFLKKHVEATLRERNTHETINKGLGSRLPRWMTAKKKRDQVLKAIDKLAAKT